MVQQSNIGLKADRKIHPIAETHTTGEKLFTVARSPPQHFMGILYLRADTL
jgi:hypothetical protein